MRRALGLLTFCALGCGAPADSLNLIESATLGATVTTDASGYTEGAPVTVTFSGMTTEPYDFITIATEGAASTTWEQLQFTDGAVSGMKAFTLSAGTYVARAYFWPSGGYTVQAESTAFSVTPATLPPPVLTTDAPSYIEGTDVTVTFSGMSGEFMSYITVAPDGSPADTWEQIAYTDGAESGNFVFSSLPPGTYRARGYFSPSGGGSYQGQSDAFTVTALPAPTSVTTDASSYSTGSTVTTSFAGMEGSVGDFIAIAAEGSAADTWVQSSSTGAATSGSLPFSELSAGSYVARAYFGSAPAVVQAESAVFTVSDLPPPATVTTNASSYLTTDPVSVTFANLEGSEGDFIAIAAEGSAADTWVQSGSTFGYPAGTIHFVTGFSAGSYVARAYFGSAPAVVQAESAVFTVSDLPPPASVTTDASSYLTTDPVTVTFANLEGSIGDFVAIAAEGSAADTWVQSSSTGAATSGSLPFSGLAAGSYVARAYFGSAPAVVQAESAVFTVADPPPPTTLSTDTDTYVVGSDVVVTFANMQGNPADFITAALDGSAAETWIAQAYTGGGTSGTVTFSGLSAGTYVARAYFWPGGGYTIQAQSAVFTVIGAPATLTTDSEAYDTGAPVVVTFSGMAGNPADFITIATDGAAADTWDQIQYTGGGTSGMSTFTGLPAGSYVARAYFWPDGGFMVQGQSAIFTVTDVAPPPPPGLATVTTDNTSYAEGSDVVVTFSDMAGDAADFITVALDGAAPDEWVSYQYTGGVLSGSLTFSGLPQATYVARAYFFPSGGLTPMGESTSFTITAAPPPPPPPPPPNILTDFLSYPTGSDVIVSFSGMEGNPADFITVATSGSLEDTWVDYVYTGGAVSGSVSFEGLADGVYVARAYHWPSGGLTAQATSAEFTIGP